MFVFAQLTNLSIQRTPVNEGSLDMPLRLLFPFLHHM